MLKRRKLLLYVVLRTLQVAKEGVDEFPKGLLALRWDHLCGREGVVSHQTFLPRQTPARRKEA